jgi:hypothetical protein
VNEPSILGPPCPTRQSATTVRVAERFGVVTFYCLDCEFSWQRQSSPPAARAMATSPETKRCPKCASVQVEQLPASVIKDAVCMTCIRCGHVWKVVAREKTP